jgi:hypothetical protein
MTQIDKLSNFWSQFSKKLSKRPNKPVISFENQFSCNLNKVFISGLYLLTIKIKVNKIMGFFSNEEQSEPIIPVIALKSSYNFICIESKHFIYI